MRVSAKCTFCNPLAGGKQNADVEFHVCVGCTHGTAHRTCLLDISRHCVRLVVCGRSGAWEEVHRSLKPTDGPGR